MSLYERFPLRTLARIMGGGTPSKGKAAYWKGDIPWVSPKDMWVDEVMTSEDMITSEAVRSSATNLVPASAILCVVRSGILARKFPIAITGREVAINQDIKAIIPGKKLDARYLYYFMKASEPAILAEVTTGATVHRVATSALTELSVPLPPVEEQRRIVAVLDEAFAAIATATANVEKNLANATSIYDASLEAYVTKALRAFGSTTLDAISIHITDGDHSPPPKAEIGIPFVTISNINKRSGKISFDKTFFVPEAYFIELRESRIPRLGDILYTVTGATLGIPSLVNQERDFCFQRHIAIIKTKDGTSAQWLLHVLRSPNVFMQATLGATGAAQKTVSLATLRGLKVPNSDMTDQSEAATRLDAIFEATEDLVRTYNAKLANLDALKQSLLHRAFTGELTATAAPETIAA